MRGTIILCILCLISTLPASAQYGDEPIRATDLLNIRQIDDVHVSPDGRQVAYVVRFLAADAAAEPGGDPLSYRSHLLTGDSLFYRTHVYVADAAGASAPRQLTRGERSASDPAWSPNGDRLAFVRSVDDTPQVFVLPMLGGEAYQATDLQYGASSPQWSPDGSRLLVTSSIPHSALRDQVGAPPPWPAERPGRPHDRTPTPGATGDLPSPDGSLAEIRAWLDRNADDGNPHVFTRPDLVGGHDLEPAPSYRHLFVVDLDTTTTPTMITHGYADFTGGAWLPDGERIAAAGRMYGDIHPDRTQERRLYLIASEGGSLDPLLDLDGFALDNPAMSPSGRLVAFTARDTSNAGYARTELGVLDLEDPAAARILTDSLDGAVSAPIWSPDGWFVYFTATTDGGVALYRTHPFELPPTDTTDVEGGPEEPAADAAAPDDAAGDVDAATTDAASTSAGDEEAAVNDTSTTHRPADRTIAIERLSSSERGIGSFDLGPATVFFSAAEASNPYEMYAASLSLDNERRLTDHHAEWIAEKRLSIPERHVLTRDSLQVEYWVMKPAFFDSNRQYPLLLQIQGGAMPIWGPGEATMWHDLQFFASQGYGIVIANPHRSGEDEYDFKRAGSRDRGAGPATAVLAAADAADDLPWVDSTRQVVIGGPYAGEPCTGRSYAGGQCAGGSYAGYLTAWTAAHDDRFRAAVFQGGERNFAHHSPLAFVEQIDTPLLIVDADDGLRTGVAQSAMLYKRLKNHGRPVEYVRYPEARHGLSRIGDPKQRVDRLLRIYEFFERFIE